MGQYNQNKFIEDILDDPVEEINKMLNTIKSSDSSCHENNDK
jgi:hypothetical protein